MFKDYIDGIEYNLENGRGKEAIEIEGWGLPDPNFHTTQGPFQQGRTLNAIRNDARTVTLFHYDFGCSRDDYWSNRRGLVNALRQNRTDYNNPSPGALRRYLSDGNIYQLDVYTSRGPKFVDNGMRGGNFDIAEELQFIAFNPFPYNPTIVNDTLTDWTCTLSEELSFPISFGGPGISFGGDICYVSQNFAIDYPGTFETFPQIIVTGPADNLTIDHVETGYRLAFDTYSIADGEVVTFDLTYGRKTVINNAGTSLLGQLSTDSDLAVFSILPDPLVAGGINDISIRIDNGNGNTAVVLSYYIRYAGI